MKKSPNQKSRDSEPAAKRSWRPFALQSLCVILSLCLACALLAEVEERVLADEQYQVDLKSLELQGLPNWLIPSQELKKNLTWGSESATIFDESLEDHLKSSLERAAWIKEVTQVQRRLPSHLDVELAIRKPVAKIRLGLKRYLIDSEATVLPEAVYRDQPLPLIENIDTRLPEEGQAWSDPTLQKALSLVEKWHQRQMAGKYKNMSLLKVKCASSQEIVSGKPHYTLEVSRRLRLYLNSGDEEGNISLDEALNNLEKILFRDPDLRFVQKYIDLRWSNPTFQ